MIKSPCRNCEKHKIEFPTCLSDCQIIKQAQRRLGGSVLDVKSRDDYVFQTDLSVATSGRTSYRQPLS